MITSNSHSIFLENNWLAILVRFYCSDWIWFFFIYKCIKANMLIFVLKICECFYYMWNLKIWKLVLIGFYMFVSIFLAYVFLWKFYYDKYHIWLQFLHEKTKRMFEYCNYFMILGYFDKIPMFCYFNWNHLKWL